MQEFNEIFPPGDYELVFPKKEAEINEFDLLRNELMSPLLRRHISFVTPELTIHSSDISPSDRKKYIPPSVLQILYDYYNNYIFWGD